VGGMAAGVQVGVSPGDVDSNPTSDTSIE